MLSGTIIFRSIPIVVPDSKAMKVRLLPGSELTQKLCIQILKLDPLRKQ